MLTATIDVFAKLHIRALEYGAQQDARHLAESWIEPVRSPWQRGRFGIGHDVPYAGAMAKLDEILARLQELTWDQLGRLAISRVHHQLSDIDPNYRPGSSIPMTIFNEH